ncbi:Hint domain-containing protein [Loktanella agnita]|uniref:Hint domain-containing protein n=1 Tax=Loktanella agnita TaxID=287097 RepID=UPI003987C0E2
MPTTFKVFSLGQLPIWDTQEGNATVLTSAVNNSLGTYGSAGNKLADNIQTFSPAGNGFGGGVANAYDLDNNNSNDQFSIDGGPPQTHDVTIVFNATITYIDGTTADITAVLFQDTNGNTYWAPEITDNADQAAIEAKGIQSLTLNQPIYDQNGNASNLGANRVDSQPLCFTPGTKITCRDGERLVEDLAVGDLVMTMDHGLQPIRWVGRQTRAAIGRMAPVRINKGVMGAADSFEVSPQHRLLLSGPESELLFGQSEVLAAAKHLVDGNGITIRQGGEVDYIHLLFDDHEIIWANGVPAETLFLGETGQAALDAESKAEIAALFPELDGSHPHQRRAARLVLKAHEAALWASRTQKQISAA